LAFKYPIYAINDILENGSLLIMWIGRDADPSFAEDIFGVPSIADIDISLRAVPVRENARSQKICALLHHIQEEERKGHYVQLQIIRQGDAFESQFRNLLIEDPEPNSMGYVDYLCQVHRQIQALNAE
jgi:protein transport protein SEC24